MFILKILITNPRMKIKVLKYGTFMLLWLKLLRQLTELSPPYQSIAFLNTKPPQIATM